MMRVRQRDRLRPCLLLTILWCASAASAAPAPAKCEMRRWAQLPVTMSGTLPLVHAAINGTDVLFIADSGAFYSLLNTSAASKFNLSLHTAQVGYLVGGLGGKSRPYLAEVKNFTIFGHDVPEVAFLVVPNEFGEDVVGVLGQNVFHLSDVEYDLANGIIRMVHAHDCRNAVLAYWAKGDQPVSELDVDLGTAMNPHTRGVAYVNGMKMRVMFDTGAGTSYLTLAAAKRAGVTPESPGVVDGGPAIGFGPNARRSWIAPFSSFRVGDEEVRNTHLRIGEGDLDADMLIGADFFLSHRIYVAHDQHTLYFTYNGGPVFNLASAAPASTPAAGEPAAAPAPELSSAAEPRDNLDAASLARRGAASSGRRDYEHALADLTRAIAMAPAEPSYYELRARAYLGNSQPDLALADFDQAIRLKPDEVPSLLARAELHAGRNDPPETLTADLQAADRAAPPGSRERVRLGNLYQYVGNMPAAIAQYSAWIDVNEREDVAMPGVLNSRCRARAQWGQELDRALEDCNKALRLRPNNAAILDTRGLVYLRQGNYGRAIADYDASLKVHPDNPWVLYCRGIAKQRRGPPGAGQADIDAALAQQPRIAEPAAKFGLTY